MPDSLTVNILPVIHGLIILAISWVVKSSITARNTPSEATVTLLKQFQMEHLRTQEVTKEMQEEHQKTQEINSGLITKVAELIVWKDGHELVDKIVHQGIDKRLDKIEDKIS